jgi:hypothetical protein
MEEVNWKDMTEPSVEIEYAYVDGRFQKKFVYNHTTFTNIIIPSPPLPGEEMIVMNIDKTWDVKPRTNQLGDEMDYVELAPSAKVEIEGLSIGEWDNNDESVGTKRCILPFEVSSLSILTSEFVAAQEDLEGYTASTTDYQDLNELKGIVACYVYVGNSGIGTPDWLVDEYKKAWEPILTKIPDNWEIIWVTTKDGSSRIEMLRF